MAYFLGQIQSNLAIQMLHCAVMPRGWPRTHKQVLFPKSLWHQDGLGCHTEHTAPSHPPWVAANAPWLGVRRGRAQQSRCILLWRTAAGPGWGPDPGKWEGQRQGLWRRWLGGHLCQEWLKELEMLGQRRPAREKSIQCEGRQRNSSYGLKIVPKMQYWIWCGALQRTTKMSKKLAETT